ncbi:LOW QUALITY PROTEIN: bolA-like protein 1, partial [Seriola dumerili]|uniref:LOW QUALITY PROTEIN: bolA-like protein 1 n=1 Tax=Seriola dumerili TaxID=41447 RepID=UPI000BBE1136
MTKCVKSVTGGLQPQPLDAPSVLRCIRPISITPALSRPLAHFQTTNGPTPSRPVERAIRTKLTNTLKPDHLEVHNESHMHAVPPGSESHFRVLVVSAQFKGLPLIQRHRLVNDALKEELSSCVHALAIQAKTPEQWGSNPTLAKSPPCMGGSRGDHTMEEKL